MANTKNYTEHGGSVTHIGGELVLDPGSKIIKDGQEIDIGGSLPPVEGSGKALVSVNGEWVEQDGYGYTERGNQTVITWDGDTEGRETLGSESLTYKVSENGVPKSALVGVTLEFGGREIAVPQEAIIEPVPNVIMIGEVIIDVIDTVEFEGATVSKGLYFYKLTNEEYVSSLTYGIPDTVHPIDNKYLSETTVSLIEMNVHWGADDDGWVIDSAPNANTIAQNILNGKYYILRITSNKYDSVADKDIMHTNFLNVAQVRHELINDTLAHVDAPKPITIAGNYNFITMNYFDDSWHWNLNGYNDK